MEIDSFISEIKSIADEFFLDIQYLDYTDITLLSRIHFSDRIFIQVYKNIKKNKLNLALIVGNSRVYGVDGEGGIYHEHPFENPESHKPISQKVLLRELVLKSIEILKILSKE